MFWPENDRYLFRLIGQFLILIMEENSLDLDGKRCVLYLNSQYINSYYL